MTLSEFSDSFDTLLNSYNVQAGFGEGSNKQTSITLDEYEKSVMLTQAQDQITKSYFDKTLNQQGQGFDDSTRRQVDFSSLVKVARFKNSTAGVLVHNDETCYDDRGLKVNLGEELKILFILNERLEVGTGDSKKSYVIVPINYRELDREMSKPYGQPLKKQAWRLFSNNSTGYDIDSEIIPIYGTVSKNNYEYTMYVYLYTSGEWIAVNQFSSGNFTFKGYLTSKKDLPDFSDLDDTERAKHNGDWYLVSETDGDDLSYVIRYVKRPTPIILAPLAGDLNIDGYKEPMECTLNPILHNDILTRAFELAITTRGGGTAQRTQSNDKR